MPRASDELNKGLLEDAEHGKQQREDFVEGCPGCKLSYYQQPGAPLPIRIMAILATLMLCNTLPVQILYPYMYFLVEDFNVKPEKIGSYAGLLASSFLVGRTITSIPWGMIGDKYGRKFVMYCSMLSLLVFNTWFGFAESFSMALTTRFLLGAFSGLQATQAAYSVEIVAEEHRAFSLALMNSMWGVGLVIGPALGGYLAKPAEKYEFFNDTLFERYPYLLPPLAVSVFGIIVTLLLSLLPETLHNHDVIQTSPRPDDPPKSSILRNKSFWISNTLFCLWAFEEICFNETFSLWAVSPGGLQLSSQDVGFVLAANGVCLLLFSTLVYPRITKRCKPMPLSRAGAILVIPFFMAFPALQSLHGNVAIATLTSLGVVRVCIAALPMASLFLLVNNSVSQEQRGTANGITSCMVSLARAIGPTIGGFIFSVAQSRPDAAVLPGNQLLFFFISMLALIVFLGTLMPIS